MFIGCCTNSRIEDLRAAASMIRGYRASPKVRAVVVPESGPVKAQAEQEGLDRVFIEAGCIPTVGGRLARVNGRGIREDV